LDKNFFGNLIINESEFLKSNRDKETVLKSSSSDKENSSATQSTNEMSNKEKIHMFGTLRIKLKKLAEQQQASVAKRPQLEIDVAASAMFMCTYRQHVFMTDENGIVQVHEASISDSVLKVKCKEKTPIVNVRGIAANQFMAIFMSFSDLSKESMKMIAKKLKLKKLDRRSGVVVYRSVDEAFGSLKFEKIIDLHNENGFLMPCGLIANDYQLFVCDRELHMIFHIDLRTDDVLQKLIMPECEPVNVCLLNESTLLVVDALKHELSLLDIVGRTNVKTKAAKIGDEFQSLNGPYDMCVMRESSIVAVKSRSDSRVLVYDFNFNFLYSFEYENSNFQGICSLQQVGVTQAAELLLVGRFVDNKNFKVGLFSSI
jgi:hypothetical protein